MFQEWFQREFRFDQPAWMFPNIVERVRNVSARVDALTSDVSPERLTARDGGKWSIQEHVGHLGDLESLWLGRVDDIFDGAAMMRVADLTNTATHEAKHNDASLPTLLDDLGRKRAKFVERMEAFDESEVVRAGTHPRLKQPMRVIDLVFFVAEHDDHHLAEMSRIARGRDR